MRFLAWAAFVVGVLAVFAVSEAQRIRAALASLGAAFSRLHPEVQVRAVRVLEDVNAELARRGDPWRVAIHQGWRSVEDQAREIAEGDSKLSHPLNGWHVWGLAVDVVFLDTLGRWTWKATPEQWAIVTAALKRHGFSTIDWDKPHGELRSLGVSPTLLRGRYGDNPLAWVATFNPEEALA